MNKPWSIRSLVSSSSFLFTPSFDNNIVSPSVPVSTLTASQGAIRPNPTAASISGSIRRRHSSEDLSNLAPARKRTKETSFVLSTPSTPPKPIPIIDLRTTLSRRKSIVPRTSNSNFRILALSTPSFPDPSHVLSSPELALNSLAPPSPRPSPTVIDLTLSDPPSPSAASSNHGTFSVLHQSLH